MEVVKEILKVVVILGVYLGVGPAAGYLIQGRPAWRRALLGFMAWWVVRPPSDFTLMLQSIEWYRGHTKGYEANFLEALAIGLALAALLERRRDFRWFPPGVWAWGLWVGAASLSVASALEPGYVAMAGLKFAKMGFVFLGVFAAIHDERDVVAMMRGFAVALILQMLLCLWLRYGQGAFRVIGWFEHQNPMAMWSYMTALPALGLALTKKAKAGDTVLFLGGFAAAGLVILLTVSRAALAAFGLGTMLVLAGSFLQGFSIKRVVVALGMGMGGVVAVGLAADTFMERMETAGDDTPENDLRWALNRQSATMLEDSPWVGIGWNNFGIANSRPRGERYSAVLEDWERNRGRAIYPEQFMANPLTESLYWLWLAETGWLGFSTFLLFLVVTVWFAVRGTWRYWKSPLGLFLWAVAVALTLTYLHGKVERVLTQTKNLTTWVMFCAVLMRVEWWRRKKVKLGGRKNAMSTRVRMRAKMEDDAQVDGSRAGDGFGDGGRSGEARRVAGGGAGGL